MLQTTAATVSATEAKPAPVARRTAVRVPVTARAIQGRAPAVPQTTPAVGHLTMSVIVKAPAPGTPSTALRTPVGMVHAKTQRRVSFAPKTAVNVAPQIVVRSRRVLDVMIRRFKIVYVKTIYTVVKLSGIRCA